VVTQCSVVVGYQHYKGPFHPEDGGSMDLRNTGILPQLCTALQPRRPRLEPWQPWKSQNSQNKWHFHLRPT